MHTTDRMLTKLDSLGFDFSRFTIEGFVSWLEAKTGRRIFMLAMGMPAGMYGAWLSDAEHPNEYIFYDDTAPQLQQVHTQLHELSHFICQHQTLRVVGADLAHILQALQSGRMPDSVLLRARNSDENEEEAEIMAMLIQSQVIQHERLSELTNVVSANAEAAAYLHNMGLE